MKTRAFLLAAIASAFVAACQTAPAAPEPAPIAEEPPVEMDLPAPPAADEPRVNEWGGEVPENKPAGNVDEGGLGDIS